MRDQWKRWTRVFGAALVGSALVGAAGCTSKTSAENVPAPQEVEVAVVQQKDIPIEREWIGTLDGMVNAAVKAQVVGNLLTQNYAEGSFVHKGQLLFEIDPRPFQAAMDQAEGQLAQAKAQLLQAQSGLLQARAQLVSAEANQQKAQLDEDRYIPLAQQQAITQQDLDNAMQTNQSQKAQVAAAKAQVETAQAQIEAARAAVTAAAAAVETAKVNLGFTKLDSPIDGIAGVATTQVGNLVGPSTNAVTTVSTLDPIKANFTVSEQEYLSLTRGDASMKHLELELILSDGTVHPYKGRFSFADRQVDSSTGAIQLTGLFPNPGNRLRPGLYGKVHASIGTRTGALLVPQRAVNEMQGNYSVAVVDPNNTIRFAVVKVGDRIGSNWIVEDGLKPGERVVTDGLVQDPSRRAGESEGSKIMSKFFINRPIVAMVISLLMVIIGTVTIVQLPIAQFPAIAPPEVQIRATYVGADAQTIEQSVATPIEQQMSGVDNLNYMYSLNAAGNGQMTMIVELRREERSEYRPDAHANARDAGRLAAAAGRDQFRRDGAEIGDRAADGDGTLFAEGHLRRQVSGQLLLHQPERPIDARSRNRQRAGIRSRPICDAPVDQAGSTCEAGHYGDRNRFSDSGAEHRESRGPGWRLAVSERPGIHVLGAGAGTADFARRVRRHRRSRTAGRRHRSSARCRAHRTGRAGLHAIRPHQRQAGRDYRRISIARHQRGGCGERRPQADGGGQETFPAGR